jgi:hypothetical protein
MRVSHEAIYQALYVQGRGALNRELVACLRTGRALRVPRGRAQQRRDGMVTPEVMISARPAEALPDKADRVETACPAHRLSCGSWLHMKPDVKITGRAAVLTWFSSALEPDSLSV